MNENSIPVLAYVFIGITTLALTYVTILDSSVADKGSALNLLPNIQNPGATMNPTLSPIVGVPVSPDMNKPSDATLPVANAVPVSLPKVGDSLPKVGDSLPKVGGKKTKSQKKKNKKTKRSHK
jgi:hypothetical protein